MSGPLTKKRALWLARETNYGDDPSADGSGYLPVPAITIGDKTDKKTPMPTNYMTGDEFETKPEAGVDGWEFTCTVPVIGLAAAVGDAGTHAANDDWFGEIMRSILGTESNTVGEGLATITSATEVDIDAPGTGIAAQSLVPIAEDAVPGTPRVQWNLATARATNTLTLAPGFADFGTVPPTTAAILMGIRAYRHQSCGGPTLAFVYREDDRYFTLRGGRIFSASKSIQAGQRITMDLSIRGDSITAETKASLPAAITAPAVTALKGIRSPIWFNGTKYETDEITFDYGIEAAEKPATEGANGRGGDDIITLKPRITFSPMRTSAVQDFKRSDPPASGRVLIQLGGGATSGSPINSAAIHLEEAAVEDSAPKDENGRQRESVTLMLTNPGEFSAGVASQKIQFARC